MNQETALVVILHGSHNPEWVEPFRQMIEALRQELGRDAIYLAFMANAQPTLMDAGREIMATSVRRCRVLPLFISKGSHWLVDIPKQIADLKKAFPALEVELLEPIGLHPLFTDLLRQIAKS